MDTYIKSLHVKEIGIFKELDVEFSPGVNLIIGANSSGKTSILKCITFCLSKSGLSYSRIRNNVEYWIDFHSDGGLQRAGATNIVDGDQAYRKIALARWGPVPETGVDKIHSAGGNVPYNLLAIGAHRFFSYKNLDGMKKEVTGAQRKQFYDSNNSKFLQMPSLPDIKQWMINRYFVIEKEWAATERQNWDNLIENLKILAPNNLSFSFAKIERDLEPIFTLNGNEVYLEELSGGFKSILSIIFSIVDWVEGVNEGELAKIENALGSVLVDEIDAHLHPEWQAKIINVLRALFPKLQFIITTHSPFLITSANKGEIIQIPNHNGTLDLKPSEKSYKNWKIENIFSELMDVSEESLYSDSTILDGIDKAIEDKNLESFEAEFKILKEALGENDSVVKAYSIKRSKIFLADD